MADNKNEKSLQDRIRVDANDPSEVEYLHQQYPSLTHSDIAEAIRTAGPMRADIIALLEKKK